MQVKDPYANLLNDTENNRMINALTQLNMDLVVAIIANAETGRLGDLYDLYEYVEAADLRLKGMINNRRKAVTKLKWSITPGYTDSEQSMSAASFVSDQIEKLQWKRVLSTLLNGRVYGIQIMHKIWSEEGGSVVLKDLVSVDSRKIEQANGFGPANRGFQFGEIVIGRYLYGTERVSANKLREENVIVLAVDKDEKGRYDLQGVMRGVLRWYLIKLFGIQSWSFSAEKFGFPTLIGKVSETDFTKNSNLMKSLLSSVAKNKWGVILDSMEVEVIEGKSSGGSDIFERLIAVANVEMAIGVLGQNLTTEVSGGSFAAGKVHLEVLDTLIADDSEWLDEIINDQIVNPLVRLNFPSLPWEEYPKYSTILPDKDDFEKKARTITLASKIVPISKAYVYSELGIPVPEEGEETIGGSGGNILDELELQ